MSISNVPATGYHNESTKPLRTFKFNLVGYFPHAISLRVLFLREVTKALPLPSVFRATFQTKSQKLANNEVERRKMFNNERLKTLGLHFNFFS